MKKRHIRQIFLLLLIIPIIYLGIQLYMLTSSAISTQIAVEEDLSESIATEGVAVRDELTIPTVGDDVLLFMLQDGERVLQGAQIALRFSSTQSAEDNAHMQRLQNEYDMLSQVTASTETVVPDVEIIAGRILDDYLDILANIRQDDYELLYEPTASFLMHSSEMNAATNTPVNVAAQLAQLSAEISALSVSGAPQGSVTAQVGGYFVSRTDGLESIITPTAAQEWTSAEVTAMLDSTRDLTTDAKTSGKIVQDYRWDYYCLIPQGEVGRITEGNNYELEFFAAGGFRLSAELEQIDEPDENGNVLLRFACNTMVPDIATIRYSSANIIVKNYYGIRVSRDALRIVDGIKGVYVKYGNLLQFKEIAPIFEDEDYLLLPLEQDEENEVKLYDEVVVEGRDLYDGKIL